MKTTTSGQSSGQNPIHSALQELKIARSKRAAELEQLDRAIRDLTNLVGGAVAAASVSRRKGSAVKSASSANSGAVADGVAVVLAKSRKRPSEIRTALRGQGIAISQKEMKKLLSSDARFSRVGMGWWELKHRDGSQRAESGASDSR